ncbi:MAG: phage terminase large subunit [Actinoallomurus sp.]
MIETTVVRYEPRGAARELFGLRTSEVAIAGPAGTGKSLACLYRLHFAALKHPAIRCLVVRKTAVSLSSTTLVTFESKVAAEALAHGTVRWFGGSQREAAAYRYSNGSRIVVGGMDKSDKVMSSDYDLIFADEATELTVEDWEKLSTRLRNGRLPWQQQLAACNPAQRTHWLKQRAESGPLAMLHSRHRDNPMLVNTDGSFTPRGEDYLAKLDALTGVRRLRLRDGIWASAEGVIYEGYDEAVHLIDPFPIPDSWRRWWSVDFGFTHVFVLQCWAEDPDGRLYLYREIYHSRRLVEDHARDILLAVTEPVPDVEQLPDEDVLKAIEQGRRRWTEPEPEAIICDHDAEDRATLERHIGMSTEPAIKTVSDGIQAVQVRMRPAGDGKVRLFIMRDCVLKRDPVQDEAKKPCSTAEEIPGYVWAVKPGTGGNLKEAPVKEDDDGCDALRYIVAERDLGIRPRISWM